MKEQMEELSVRNFPGRGEQAKIHDVDKQLIDSIVRSGFNKLSYLDLSLNYLWWQDVEIQE